MTQTVIWIIAVIGTALACVFVFQKKKNYALLAAGQMLVAPYATFNLLTENGMLWKIIFVLVVLAGLIAVYCLAVNQKEK